MNVQNNIYVVTAGHIIYMCVGWGWMWDSGEKN